MKSGTRIYRLGLSPDNLLQQVQARIDELQKAIDFLQVQLDKAPEGALYGSRSHAKWQWQRKLNSERTYLSGRHVQLIRSLAQKKYNALVLDNLKHQRDVLDGLLEAYHPQNGEAIYASMPIEWRNEIIPLNLPDEEYAEQWQNLNYRRKPVENTGFLTAKGEYVRSKSEIIIADTLNNLGVPYRYEYPHELLAEKKTHRVKVFSDFTCLNIRTRKEIVWEHFGIMDNPDYAQNAVSKIELYENSGYFPGDNLIFTMERLDKPLNSGIVRQLVKKYLI